MTIVTTKRIIGVVWIQYNPIRINNQEETDTERRESAKKS